MPYAKNGNINIYYEVEGEGTPLVLGNGASTELSFWRNYGYVDALKQDYQLVLFDIRGQGKSDKPHKVSDYGLNCADDVIAILDTLGLQKSHYLGFSMGGWIAYKLALHYPERFLSFIIADMSPYEGNEESIKATKAIVEMLSLLFTDQEAYLKRVERFFNRSMTPAEKDRWLAQDAEAGIAVVESIQQGPPLTDQELESISVPCLLYCGELDPFHYLGMKESANHIPGTRFISVPEIDHGGAWARSDLMLPHIKEFLTKVTQGA
jgi:pimeloyl-ACP methyl ester carboxylesterase